MKFWMTVLAALCVAGCESGGGEAFGPEDDRFVETMVALRRAAIEAGQDTAAFEASKQALLEERGVTDDSLRAYVARKAGDLQAMAAIWDSVNSRLSAEAGR